MEDEKEITYKCGKKLADILNFCHKLNFIAGFVCGGFINAMARSTSFLDVFLSGIALILIINFFMAKIVIHHVNKVLAKE